MSSPSPLTNRSVAVTGGTGSFGHAFVRRALDVGAERVVVFSRDELKQSQMAAEYQDDRLRFFIGTVTDQARVTRALKGVDIVVHAAALKQVPACESNPMEALQTNALGTCAVALAAIEAGVWRGCFLSTDKAASPCTMYGHTKAAAERAWLRANVYAAGTRTRLVATRYGNVIGSRGSVIPVFRAQAAHGGPLTVTDPDMTRYWMRMQDAVGLVELAIREGRGGEVFVPMLPSAAVQTIADAIAPGVDQQIVGVRPSEKLHEMLISADESPTVYNCGTHYRIEPDRTWEYLPPLGWPKVPAGWSYRSDTNPNRLGVDEMRALIGDA